MEEIISLIFNISDNVILNSLILLIIIVIAFIAAKNIISVDYTIGKLSLITFWILRVLVFSLLFIVMSYAASSIEFLLIFPSYIWIPFFAAIILFKIYKIYKKKP